MARIGSVVLNVTDIGRAATFWRNALGYVFRESGNPGALVSQRGEGPALLLDETDRTHLDLHVASEEEQQAEPLESVDQETIARRIPKPETGN